MNQLREQTIAGAHVLLPAGVYNYLGPKLRIVDGEIIIQASAQNLTVTEVEMLRCRVRTTRKLSNFAWHGARIKESTFAGRYSGNDFGQRVGQAGETGSVQGCDFSQSVLDACRFSGPEITDNVYPRWPCFVIHEPLRAASELKRVQWPGRVSIMMNLPMAPDVRVLALSSVDLVKQLGGTSDQLRAALDTLPPGIVSF
ncbi:MAG: hypothetical protein V4850_32435 [Myxococcota bacterium]